MIIATKPAFMPALAEIFVVMGAVKVLFLGLLSKKNVLKRTFNYAIVVLLSALIALCVQPRGMQITFNGLFLSDAFTILIKIIVLFSGVITLIVTRLTVSYEGLGHFEYPALILFSLAGMMMMISAHDLISLFMGLELQSLSLYVLVGMRRHNSETSEAALKYFLLGALSTGILLYGSSLVYGFTGLTDFEMLERFFIRNSFSQLSIGPIIGVTLILVALGFKVATAPFHLWIPDVYQGTSTSLTMFLATAPKIAGIAVLMKVLMSPFNGLSYIWQPLLMILSILSMGLGAFAALTQTNIKRFIAYSSVGHIGFLSVGILIANAIGLRATLVYSVIYIFSILLFFSSLLYLQRQGKTIETLNDLKGLRHRHPGIAFLLSFTLFSLAGIPPLPGFIAKIIIFRAAANSGYYVLCSIIVIYSLICAGYYLLVLKTILMDQVENQVVRYSSHKRDLITALAILFLIILLILCFIRPDFLIDAAQQAVFGLMYL